MSTPGNGATARVISSTSGKEWYGEVLVWGPRGEPFLRDAETAEVRWFPRSWVKDVANAPAGWTPPPCSCKPPETRGWPEPEILDAGEPDRGCHRHGDPQVVASSILKAARSRA
ncbi:hypothetical protein OG474_09820 [Kribbella sp. NBC_01505]|uniref:hypothetical protein n=1 Tax=Kribbella sp. NBC_01505 TaxID=2903580 RepID=UPI00386CC3E3